MGLDMYLYRTSVDTVYPVYRNDFTEEEEDAFNEQDEKVQQEEVAYWRKFNALHSWFVDNCQDGVDECQPSLVTKEQIEELIAILTKSLDTKKPILQPKGGFFFGSTTVDDYYWDDVKNTLEVLTDVYTATDFDFFKLIYQASW